LSDWGCRHQSERVSGQTHLCSFCAQVHHLTEWWKTCKTDEDDDGGGGGPATMSTKRSVREERRLDRLVLSTTI
jgi:hypothetical protein